MAPSGTRRRVKIYLIGSFAGLAIFAVICWLALPSLVERGLISRMTSDGIPVSQLTVTAVGFNKAVIDNLRIGDNGALTVGRIVANFTIGDLFAGKVDSIEIRDLRVAARLGPNGLVVSGLERTGTPERQFGVSLDRVPRIAIENGRIDLSTDMGRVTVPFSATIAPAADRALHAAIEARAETEMGRIAGRIDVQVTDRTASADIRIDDGTISIGDSLQSNVAGHLLAKLTADQEPTLKGDLKIGSTIIEGMSFSGGTMLVDGSARNWTSDLSLVEDDGRGGLQAKLTVADADDPSSTSLEVRLSATAASGLWRFAGLSAPLEGQIHVDLNLTGRRPSEGWVLASKAEPGVALDFLTGGDLDGSVNVRANNLAFPSIGDLQSATASFDLRAVNGQLDLKPTSTLQVAFIPAEDIIESLQLPAETTRALDGLIKADVAFSTPLRIVGSNGGMTAAAEGDISIVTSAGAEAALGAAATLRLSPKFEPVEFVIAQGSAQIHGIELPVGKATSFTFDGEIKGSPGRLDGQAKVRGLFSAVRLGEFSAQETQVDLDTDIQLNDGRLDLRLANDGVMVLRRLSSPYLAARLEELSLSIAGSSEPLLSAQFDASGVIEFSHAVQLGAINKKVPLLIGGAKPTRTTLRSRGATLTGNWTNDSGYRANLDFSEAAITLPDQQIAAQALRVEFRKPPGHETRRLDFSIGKIQSSQTPAAFVPLGFSGAFEFAGDHMVMKGRLGDSRKAIEMAIDLTHSFAARKGRLELTMRPVQFRSDGLQPKDLLPTIGARIGVAEGSAAIAGGLSWNEGKVRSDLKLLLQDVDAALPQLDIIRLNSVIAIKSLTPFSTARSQQMAIGLLDIGVPLSDALASFRIEPGPKFVVEDARLSLAGGRVAVGPIQFDPGNPRIDTTLQVTDVELGRLLELAAIEGLTATGRLAGQIPLALDNGAIAIRDAVLDATEPGILRYAPKQTPAALEGAGESVALALQALSNFQYTELRLTLNRAAGGDTVALMHVKGHNPDFYGGYPVEFNLNVSGKLDQILDRGLSGYRVPDTIRERLQELTR